MCGPASREHEGTEETEVTFLEYIFHYGPLIYKAPMYRCSVCKFIWIDIFVHQDLILKAYTDKYGVSKVHGRVPLTIDVEAHERAMRRYRLCMDKYRMIVRDKQHEQS